MIPKKLVFLGSKPIGYKCFEYLIQQRESLNVEITGLLTQQRKEFGGANDLANLANIYNIPVISGLENLPECDIIYSVQYHEILKDSDIGKAGQAAVNLHMAPLPQYRGCNQFSFAILDDAKEFGTTIHIMDTGIDHGAIIFQKRFPLPENCWVSDLYDLTEQASIRLFTQTLKHIIEENYNVIPQEDLVDKYGTSIHYRHEIQRIKQISIDWPSEKIQRHIRATYMPGFEPPYFLMDGKKVHFTTDDQWKRKSE